MLFMNLSQSYPLSFKNFQKLSKLSYSFKSLCDTLVISVLLNLESAFKLIYLGHSLYITSSILR